MLYWLDTWLTGYFIDWTLRELNTSLTRCFTDRTLSWLDTIDCTNHWQDTYWTGQFIDQTFHLMDTSLTGHFIDWTLHWPDTSLTRPFIDKTLHWLDTSLTRHFINWTFCSLWLVDWPNSKIIDYSEKKLFVDERTSLFSSAVSAEEMFYLPSSPRRFENLASRFRRKIGDFRRRLPLWRHPEAERMYVIFLISGELYSGNHSVLI